MKKKIITKFEAFDGKIFDNANDCDIYERQNNLRRVAEEKLWDIRDQIAKLLEDNGMGFDAGYDGVRIFFNDQFDDLGVSL